MFIPISEPGVSGLGFSAVENGLEAVLPREIRPPTKTWNLEAAFLLAPGSGESIMKASRRIDGICKGAYHQMDRRASDLLQARRAGLWKSGPPARGGIIKDGSRFPAVVSVTALRDAQNAIIGYLLIGTDNTARMVIEAERTRLDQALQDKNTELMSARIIADKANPDVILIINEFMRTVDQALEDATTEVSPT